MSSPAQKPESPEVLITPESGQLGPFLRELYIFRELLSFLVWKDIKVQFAQTTLGLGWLILRPMLNVFVMTLVFGKIAKVPSDGAPYLLFALAGFMPWGYFQASVSKGAMSLVGNAALVTKIYFPRIYIPVSIMLSGLVEFMVTFCLFLVASAFYGHLPPADIWMLPIPLFLLLLTTAGVSLWLASLAVDFRDVRYATQYLMQMMMFAAPVIWPLSLLPQRFGATGAHFLDWYAIYPLVGVVEGFRHTLLGTGSMPWSYIATGYVTAIVLIITGLAHFRRRERSLADLV